MTSRITVPAPEVSPAPVTEEPCITLAELMGLRAELDSMPGRSASELDDELHNLTEGDGATDTLASFRHELGLCADGEPHASGECPAHNCENFIAELEALAPWGTSGHGLRAWAE